MFIGFSVVETIPNSFISAASERFRRNSIASLKLQDGSIVSDHVGKAQELFQTYKNRLGMTEPHEMKFGLAWIIKKIEGLDELTKPFTHEEIVKVVREMPSDKAPSPDGFNGCFLNSYWHIIKMTSTSSVMTSLMEI